MLFNKRQNEILISKIIKKYESMNEKILKIEEFKYFNEKNMLSNEFLEFNIYNQKLSFNSSLNEECQKGYFLLIAYYSKTFQIPLVLMIEQILIFMIIQYLFLMKQKVLILRYKEEIYLVISKKELLK